jgi:PAS domain S-box-containing protein
VESLAESEERFRNMFEQNEDAIILLRRKNLDLIDANHAAEQLFGYSCTELKRLGLLAFIASEEYGAFIAMFPQQGDVSAFNLDRLINLRKSGEAITVSVWGKIILLRNEEVIYCSIRNITDRIRMEEEMRTTQGRLIHANKMTSLGVLVSGIAHEINNPNTFIQSNASILEKVWRDAMPILARNRERSLDIKLGGLPFEEIELVVPRFLLGVKEGSRRISSIVGNLKNYAREDKSPRHNSIDVNKVIRDGAMILGPLIHRFWLPSAEWSCRTNCAARLIPCGIISSPIGWRMRRALPRSSPAVPGCERSSIIWRRWPLRPSRFSSAVKREWGKNSPPRRSMI